MNRLTIPTIHEPITVSTKVLQMEGLLTTLTVLTMIHSLVPNKVIGRVIPCGSTAVEELRETRTRPCSATHLQKGDSPLNGVCRATKRDGSPCTLPVKGPDGYCWAHSPEHADERRRAASRAGRSRPSREVRDLKADLRELITRVEEGQLSPTRANTMIRAFSVLLDYIKLERGVYLEEELAARLEALKGERENAS